MASVIATSNARSDRRAAECPARSCQLTVISRRSRSRHEMAATIVSSTSIPSSKADHSGTRSEDAASRCRVPSLLRYRGRTRCRASIDGRAVAVALTGGHGWIENRPTRGFRGLDLRELWAYRELAAFLALRDVKVRYKQAAFGAGWAVLQPLAGVAVFTVVFRDLAGVPSDGVPYPLFAYVGLTIWAYFSGSATKATQSLVQNAPLVSKIYFPRIIAPVAGVLPGLLDLLIALALLAVLLPVYGRAPGWEILTVPLLIIPLVLSALAVGLWLGTLNVMYRDVSQGITLIIQLLLFISPVAYPASAVPGSWRTVYFLNPVAGIIEAFRWAILGGPWPGGNFVLSLSVTVVLLAGGTAYFLRVERRFADVI